MVYITILCKSDNNTAKTTNRCLDSIYNAANAPPPFDDVEIYIVESGDNMQYRCKKTIRYDKDVFNYNHACNLAIDDIFPHMKNNDWLCIMNNDIVCDEQWLYALSTAVKMLPTIQSMCPNAENIQPNESSCKILLGHILKKTFNGCCFFLRKDVIEKIGKFDENFSFYFQDDDLLEQLIANNIQHGLVIDSKIKHIGQDTTGPEDIDKLTEGALAFINKYSLNTYLLRERQKLYKIKFNIPTDK